MAISPTCPGRRVDRLHVPAQPVDITGSWKLVGRHRHERAVTPGRLDPWAEVDLRVVLAREQDRGRGSPYMSPFVQRATQRATSAPLPIPGRPASSVNASCRSGRSTHSTCFSSYPESQTTPSCSAAPSQSSAYASRIASSSSSDFSSGFSNSRSRSSSRSPGPRQPARLACAAALPPRPSARAARLR